MWLIATVCGIIGGWVMNTEVVRTATKKVVTYVVSRIMPSGKKIIEEDKAIKEIISSHKKPQNALYKFEGSKYATFKQIDRMNESTMNALGKKLIGGNLKRVTAKFAEYGIKVQVRCLYTGGFKVPLSSDGTTYVCKVISVDVKDDKYHHKKFSDDAIISNVVDFYNEGMLAHGASLLPPHHNFPQCAQTS